VKDKNFLNDYFTRMSDLIKLDNERVDQILNARDIFCKTRSQGGKVIFIGNGGSSAISSHIAIDLSKNADVRAISFGDSATVTCLANDFGYENWMMHAVRIYADSQDCLVGISSSGKSANVLKAVEYATNRGLQVITLSGMDKSNPLSNAGHLNFWVNSYAYNIIETMHQFILMSIVDRGIGKAEYPAIPG
jgi:phosphoheptose isomerase